MKHTNKFFLLLMGFMMTLGACNKDDNYRDWEQEQARIDSIRKERLAEQAPLLKAYVDNPENGWTNPRLDSATSIWFEVLAAGNESSYTYKLNGNRMVMPSVEVKYKGQLLNGTIFDQTDETSPNKKTIKLNLSEVIPVWRAAFFPKQISLNGQNYPIGGLTTTGLKKGSKIRFVSPSPWAYDTEARDKIPANSPLVFEIEVVNISDML